MGSIEAQFAWGSMCSQALALFHRLNALSLQIELLSESLKPSQRSLLRTLEALRSEAIGAARDAQAIADEARAHGPRPGSTNLNAAVRDTLAPLDRHLERRETSIEVGEIPPDLEVDVEPALVRAAIAIAVDLLTRGARPGEVLRVSRIPLESSERVQLALETRMKPIDPAALGTELAPVRSMLAARGGMLEVERREHALIVALDLARAVKVEPPR